MFEAPILDPVRFTALGDVVEGRVPASGCDRLAELLYRPQGEIRYRVTGYRTPDGLPALALHLEGDLELVCQRCLGGLSFPLNVDSAIIMVRDAAALPDLEAEAEGVDVIVQPAKVALVDLLEEEILLALPLVPVHAEGMCGAGTGDTPQAMEQKRPFAALERLKTSS